MSELEKRILNTFGRVVPKLSERGKEKLLFIGEGMALSAGVMELEECSCLRLKGDEKKTNSESDPIPV